VARAPLSTSVLASLLLHGALFALLLRAPAPKRVETVAIEVIEQAPPPRPPPVSTPPPAPRAPPRVAALPPDAPERRSPAPEPPPPPNEAPPPDAPPPAKAPVKLGISLSSTTASGSFAAPVGNTLYGELPKVAPRPEEVKPYAAEKVVPPTQVTVLPRPVATEIGREHYPPAALAQGLEGRVVLRLLVDETGRVVDAAIVEDPGHGFGEAAARAARGFRFEPAQRAGTPVATWLRFTVSFEIP
jgi:protein TonB